MRIVGEATRYNVIYILAVKCSDGQDKNLWLGNQDYKNPVFVDNESDAYRFSDDDTSMYDAWFTIGDMDKIWFKCELYSIQYVDADVIFK